MSRMIKEELFEIGDNEFRVMLLEKEEWEGNKKALIGLECDLMDVFTPKQLNKLGKRLIKVAERFEKAIDRKEVSDV